MYKAIYLLTYLLWLRLTDLR